MNRLIALAFAVALAGGVHPAAAQPVSMTVSLEGKTPAAIQAEVTRAAYSVCAAQNDEFVMGMSQETAIQRCVTLTRSKALNEIKHAAGVRASQLAVNSKEPGAH